MAYENVMLNVKRFFAGKKDNLITLFHKLQDKTRLMVPYISLKEINNELRLQKAYFQQLFEGSPEGIVMLDNSDRIVSVNNGFEKLFMCREEEVKGLFLNDVIVPENLYGEASEYSSIVLEGNILQEDAVRKRMDGNLVDVHILGYPIMLESEHVGIYGIYRDISEDKKAQEKIKYLSFHDKLTDLYNRAFFEEELKRLDTERQLPVSMIMGDLNNLKLANDVFGHEEGDKLLVKVAGILKKCCRQEDIIARWGGDEFIILLPKTDENTALNICQRIRDACMECTGGPVQPSIALGAATKKKLSQNIEKILNEAEHSMYRNKFLDHKNSRGLSIPSWNHSYPGRNHGALHNPAIIEIPHDILEKSGSLTAEEWQTVRKQLNIILSQFCEIYNNHCNNGENSI